MACFRQTAPKLRKSPFLSIEIKSSYKITISQAYDGPYQGVIDPPPNRLAPVKKSFNRDYYVENIQRQLVGTEAVKVLGLEALVAFANEGKL
jgi:hypothetical protein